MAKFQFRDRIPINVTQTLVQLLSRFQGVKDGLPELIKNSKDQYSRLGVTERDSRVIVVVVDTSQRSIGVLDFAGAAAQQFTQWETWSDPGANARDKASDIEGGHGNGGKAFMVLGSTTDSSFESCFQGKRTRMGYDNKLDSTKFKPGIAVEAGKAIEDVPVSSVRKQFDKALADLGIKFDQLPRNARDGFEARSAYTIAQVNGIKDWARPRDDTVRRLALEIPRAVECHPQTALTLESCNVWFVIDGQVVGDGPSQVGYPEPFPGFSEPLQVPVPDFVHDPTTKEMISTGERSPDKALTLRTSSKSLRTEDLRPWHVVRVRNQRNIVGLWSVADLSPGAASGFVFGEVRVAALDGEHLAGADRKSLNETPLVRGLEAWAGQQIKALADKIQQATAREHKQEDRDKVNESLKKLRDLMRDFLSDRNTGIDGAGAGNLGSGQSGNRPRPEPREKGEQIDVIELEGKAASIAIAVGATVPLRVKAFEQTPSGDLKPAPVVGASARVEPQGIVQIDHENQITAILAGTATVWFEVHGSEVKSNVVQVETVSCSGAAISGVPDRALLQGEHVNVKAAYQSESGQREDLLHDASIDELEMGRISRNGVFVAGSREGTATLRFRWGPNQIETASAIARIGVERVPPRRGVGGDSGGGIPSILLCGTAAPGMEQYPPDQRTIMPSEHLPTIIDFDPAFENVIFINPDSKESIQARKGRGGTQRHSWYCDGHVLSVYGPKVF